MSTDKLVEDALRSRDPVLALRAVAQRWITEGQARDDVLRSFEKLRQEYRASGREAEEDVIVDVMDFLVGWCSPSMRIS